jgi:hypothetical protein
MITAHVNEMEIVLRFDSLSGKIEHASRFPLQRGDGLHLTESEFAAVHELEVFSTCVLVSGRQNEQ